MFSFLQRREYVESERQHCPHCKSKEVEPGDFATRRKNLLLRMTCKSCGHEWLDIFSLTGIEAIEDSHTGPWFSVFSAQKTA